MSLPDDVRDNVITALSVENVSYKLYQNLRGSAFTPRYLRTQRESTLDGGSKVERAPLRAVREPVVLG
jgi:hypothetical protein